MPKIVRELTALQVKNLKTPGRHAVGGVPGLLLKIGDESAPGSKPSRSWIFRARINGRRVAIGLGSYSSVSLADARQLAREQRALVDAGLDPIEVKSEKNVADAKLKERNKTFKDCAEMYLDHRLKSLSNEKHKKQWRSTLEKYAYPFVGDKHIEEISIHDVRDLLEQETVGKDGVAGSFWDIKTETASRVRGRIYDVFAFAITKEFRTSANPAEWRGRLSTLLPSPEKIKKVRHHDFIPYAKAPHFMSKLLGGNSITRKALAFLMLTGVRSGSVRYAEWEEIDFKNKIWTIPPEHEKTGNGHRVALSSGAIKILKSMVRLEGCELIFPSPWGNVLSDAAISKTMKDMRARGEIKYAGVPHGCRATFRTWAADKTNYPDEVRQAASGHKIGDPVKAAYQRGDFLEKRRALMEDWSEYLMTKISDK